MKHAGSSAITVSAQHIQRLIYPMLQQRFDYPLCRTKNSHLKCNLSLLPRYRNSPALPYPLRMRAGKYKELACQTSGTWWT